jgi:hypothetical protein
MLTNEEIFLKKVPEKYLNQTSPIHLVAGQLAFVQTAGKELVDGRDKIIVVHLTVMTDWEKILRLATHSELVMIISGIEREDIFHTSEPIIEGIPSTVPGQLLRILYDRFAAFGGDKERGLPLLFNRLNASDEGQLLSLILESAHLNASPFQFFDWLEEANEFYYLC